MVGCSTVGGFAVVRWFRDGGGQLTQRPTHSASSKHSAPMQARRAKMAENRKGFGRCTGCRMAKICVKCLQTVTQSALERAARVAGRQAVKDAAEQARAHRDAAQDLVQESVAENEAQDHEELFEV